MPNENLNIQQAGMDVNDLDFNNLEVVLDFDYYNLEAALIESSLSSTLAVNLLNMCNNCDCCARHEVNRPAIYEPWVELDIHVQDDDDEPYDPPCDCSCRHVARWVCRNHPDNPDSPSPILDEDPEQPNCPPPQD